jgi:hypothetical protein
MKKKRKNKRLVIPELSTLKTFVMDSTASAPLAYNAILLDRCPTW